METVQAVVICAECGSTQAAEVPMRLCACDSEHARDVKLLLHASRLCSGSVRARLVAVNSSPAVSRPPAAANGGPVEFLELE